MLLTPTRDVKKEREMGLDHDVATSCSQEENAEKRNKYFAHFNDEPLFRLSMRIR